MITERDREGDREIERERVRQTERERDGDRLRRDDREQYKKEKSFFSSDQQ